jgi:hypothetical protein
VDGHVCETPPPMIGKALTVQPGATSEAIDLPRLAEETSGATVLGPTPLVMSHPELRRRIYLVRLGPGGNLERRRCGWNL